MEQVGARLKAAREEQGISLSDIVATTRISRSTLEAIESGDPARLPAPVYTRGFVRAYAKIVGLDPQAMSRDADLAMRPTEPSRPTRGRWNADTSFVLGESRATRGPKPGRGMGTIGATGPRVGLRISHLLLLFVALGMFLTAWLTVGVGSGETRTAAAPEPLLLQPVDGTSGYTRTDTARR